MNTNEKSSPMTSSEKKDPKPLSEFSQHAVKEIEALGSPEEKIQKALEFMREALSQVGSPRFKDFWDIRALCVPFFRSAMSQGQRAELWAAYIEISTEAKRLKEIIEEQSAFAIEQIELAILALEKDLTEYARLIQQLPFLRSVERSTILKDKKEDYEAMQRELHLLNALAARVNSLRKEVVKTDMRIRIRGKFFDRLSLLGDQIFPRRKELIKNISGQFTADVEHFTKMFFSPESADQKKPPYYILREEIKLLQSIAKELTLSTQAFNVTREQLSQCWDLLREWDKKRKENLGHKKHAVPENVEREPLHPHEEKENLKKQVLAQLYQDMKKVVEEIDILPLEEVLKKKTEIEEKLSKEIPDKAERMRFETLQRKLKDMIADKRTTSLLRLPKKEIEGLQTFQSALEEQISMRNEIKRNLENYRRSLGNSGFGFERAMEIREMIDSDKERLTRLNLVIQELEDKIDELGR